MRTKTTFRINTPEIVVKTLIEDLEIDISKPTDLMYIADRLNIVVTKRTLAKDVRGGFMVKGLKKLIVLDPDIKDEGQERFTFAHEIGHVAQDHCTRCCEVENFNMLNGISDNEKSANIFSSEILMPSEIITAALNRNELNLHLIEKLASERIVAVTDMAMRAVMLSDEPCIAVCFGKKKIEWCCNSSSCQNIKLSKKSTLKAFQNLQPNQIYKATDFLIGVSKRKLCYVEMKHYENLNSHIGFIRLI